MHASLSSSPREDLDHERLLERQYTPHVLRIVSDWCWRFIVIVIVAAAAWWLMSYLATIVVPVFVAIMVTAALMPFLRVLRKHNWPDWLSALVSLLLLLIVFIGLLTIVGAQIASQWNMLVDSAVTGFQSFLNWLADGPLKIDQGQVDEWISQLVAMVSNSQDKIAAVAATLGSRIGGFFAGAAIMLFATFFFLKDGKRFGQSMERRIPEFARPTFAPAFKNGWESLVIYMRAAITVAGIDGVGAGLGALFLGSNMWLAILALTFVCSFVPLIGALIAGTVAVVVVLVTLGPIKAIIMLAVFVAVMSIESNVLQPMILGRAAEIHPLIVLLGISVGSVVAGVPGALFAIPLVAFITGMTRSSHSADEEQRTTVKTKTSGEKHSSFFSWDIKFPKFTHRSFGKTLEEQETGLQTAVNAEIDGEQMQQKTSNDLDETELVPDSSETKDKNINLSSEKHSKAVED